MGKKIFDTENVDLSTFELFVARNGQLDMETAAVRVTTKNIGSLALAFDTEVSQQGGTYYFVTQLKREDMSAYLTFRVGDVLVFVRDEIHRFPEEIFNNTFTTNELIEYRCSVCGKISGDNEQGTYSEMHPSTDGLAYCDMNLKV